MLNFRPGLQWTVNRIHDSKTFRTELEYRANQLYGSIPCFWWAYGRAKVQRSSQKTRTKFPQIPRVSDLNIVY